MGVLAGFLAAAIGFYVADLVHPENEQRRFLLAIMITLPLMVGILIVLGLTGLLV